MKSVVSGFIFFWQSAELSEGYAMESVIRCQRSGYISSQIQVELGHFSLAGQAGGYRPSPMGTILGLSGDA